MSAISSSPAATAPSPLPGGPKHREPGDILTVDEAARLLRIGRNSLYDAVNRGAIPHRRIGRNIRLSRAVLMQWFEGDRCGAKKGR